MSYEVRDGKYADDVVVEDDVLRRARAQSRELGIDAVAPAVGAQMAVIVAAARARSIVEIGTGAGVSGLWLLRASETATLTSIDSELDHQQQARAAFGEARIAPNRVRLITGRAADVLPRMNEDSYDVVVVDADPAQVVEHVEHALRLVKPGGAVLVPHALWHGRVADPARRDETSVAFRTLVDEIAASPAVVGALSPVGDGLLQLVTR